MGSIISKKIRGIFIFLFCKSLGKVALLSMISILYQLIIYEIIKKHKSLFGEISSCGRD